MSVVEISYREEGYDFKVTWIFKLVFVYFVTSVIDIYIII